MKRNAKKTGKLNEKQRKKQIKETGMKETRKHRNNERKNVCLANFRRG